MHFLLPADWRHQQWVSSIVQKWIMAVWMYDPTVTDVFSRIRFSSFSHFNPLALVDGTFSFYVECNCRARKRKNWPNEYIVTETGGVGECGAAKLCGYLWRSSSDRLQWENQRRFFANPFLVVFLLALHSVLSPLDLKFSWKCERWWGWGGRKQSSVAAGDSWSGGW